MMSTVMRSTLRRTLGLRGLAPAVALAVAIASMPARAGAPPADFEQRIADADAHTSEGRHAEALQSYAEAFAAMPPELKASGVGEFVAMAAANAAIADFEARGDRTSLETGRMVLLGFVGAAQSAGPGVETAPIDGAKQRLAELDARMPAPEATPAGPPPAPEAEAPAKPTPTRESDTTPDRRGLAIGLTVAGGVVAIAGVGLLVAGARQVPWYEAKLESEGWVPTDPGYGAEIDAAKRIRNIDIGLGAAALVVGVGVGVTGAVLLAKRRQGGRTMALWPVLERERAMLGATMRF